MTPLHEKSSNEKIRQRFDIDVERFSNLETGQQAAMDAVLILELVARSAASRLPVHGKMLDLGCGAGNFTLRVLKEVSSVDCVLADLSAPMLERAAQRVKAATSGSVETIHSDMRLLHFEPGSFDVILAGQVFHHLREDEDWQQMFARLHRWLKPSGTLFVADLVEFDDPAIQALALAKYAEHLDSIGGPEYRDKVLAICEIEDSPRSIKFQFDCLREAGFSDYDVLHRNALFAAYYATR